MQWLKKYSVWTGSSPAIAAKAQKLAFESMLPKLGFTEICDVTKIMGSVPFDSAAAYYPERVSVDVTGLER
jgi:hypothetical protein